MQVLWRRHPSEDGKEIMTMHSIIPEIGISILAATVLGFIFQSLRQPAILGYLVAGALIGPAIGFGLVTEPANIKVISEIGLILLLFIIGLELNPVSLLSSGRQLVYAGLGQFIFCVMIGIGFFSLIGYGLGKGNIDALYLALFCSLSSTAIVVKLLYDKFELDTFPGRMSLGILIFQDIWAILVLALQPNFLNPDILIAVMAIGKSLVLLAIGFLLSRYLLKWVFEKIAKTPEMVVGMAIAWCVLMAGIGSWIGLSMEMGALIAGVAISSFPYGVHIIAKVLPMRDSFLTLFFLSIGMTIPMPTIPIIMQALIVVLFVILSRFLTVYPILSLSGSGRRTAVITSLNLAQISEFSLVIASIGLEYGHIKESLVSMTIYAMAITSVLSSYFINGNHQIYLVVNRLLDRIGFRTGKEVDASAGEEEDHPIVFLGFHRGANAVTESLEHCVPDLLKKILVIDFNLEVLKALQSRGIKGVFGDISSMDTLHHAHVEKAKIILATIPDMLLKGTSNAELVRTCRALAPNAMIVATADSVDQSDTLKSVGANEVILPYSLIGDRVSRIVTDTFCSLT